MSNVYRRLEPRFTVNRYSCAVSGSSCLWNPYQEGFRKQILQPFQHRICKFRSTKLHHNYCSV